MPLSTVQRLAIALAIALLIWVLIFLVVSCARGEEAQGWLTDDVHIHTIWDLPNLSILDKPLTVPVTTLLHNQTAHLAFVRWSDGSNVIESIKTPVQGDGTGEQKIPVNFTLDPARFANSGWQEVRFTSNIDKPQREYTTTRLCLFVVNGKKRSDYCGGPTVAGRCGAGAWYPDTKYLVVFVDCRDVNRSLRGPAFSPGDKIRVKFQDGLGQATVDPHFHMGDRGTVIARDLPKNTWTTVTLPPLSPGAHKLHLRSTARGEAGAYVLPLVIG
jgi:hypothetical protein